MVEPEYDNNFSITWGVKKRDEIEYRKIERFLYKIGVEYEGFQRDICFGQKYKIPLTELRVLNPQKDLKDLLKSRCKRANFSLAFTNY